MITALLVALILIAIVCVVGQAITKLVPMPSQVVTVVWAVVAIVCLLILLDVFTGQEIVGFRGRIDID